MSASKQVTPWPLWGRALFWTVVVVVLVLAAAAAFHGRFHGAAVRIVIAVVVVPGIVAIIGSLFTRRSDQSR